jgi:DNA polymerase III sliding clamp (beta) subunit (PCNA family)
MKFIVSSSALLKQLQQINGVIGSNNVLPILEDFLFEIEKNKLSVVATDLETVMKIQLDIEAKDSGRVCIPAKILMDSLDNLNQTAENLTKFIYADDIISGEKASDSAGKLKASLETAITTRKQGVN